MGNVSSKSVMSNKNVKNTDDSRKKLLAIMDIVAANYATTKLGLNDYDKLKNQDKCNELVVLTSDMIANKFKMLDIIYLKQRTEYGSNISDPQDKSKKAYGSTKVMYGNKKSLMDSDEKVPWKKRRLCNGIAKFYVRIAQIYAAIVKSINPQLKFKDKDIGSEYIDDISVFDEHRVSSSLKDKIFESVEFSLCGKIKDQLVGDSSLKVDTIKNINIKPEFCKMTSHLKDEPGILELEELFKDEYDYDTGVYKIGSNRETRKRYMEIYSRFYKIFTGKDFTENIDVDGNKPLPLFSKIVLSDFNVCTDEEFKEDRTKMITQYKVSNPIISEKTDDYKKNVLKHEYDKEHILFIEYAKLLKNFMVQLNIDEMNVLSILKDLFKVIETEDTDIDDMKETITIHPDLNDKTLNDVARRAREYILGLYINCKEGQSKLHSVFREILTVRNTIRLHNPQQITKT